MVSRLEFDFLAKSGEIQSLIWLNRTPETWQGWILGVLNARDDIDDGQRPRERWFTQLHNAWFLFQDLVQLLKVSFALVGAFFEQLDSWLFYWILVPLKNDPVRERRVGN